eukprot:scaffold36497_cov242-Isochrysis_galbana.AAC.1
MARLEAEKRVKPHTHIGLPCIGRSAATAAGGRWVARPVVLEWVGAGWQGLWCLSGWECALEPCPTRTRSGV